MRAGSRTGAVLAVLGLAAAPPVAHGASVKLKPMRPGTVEMAQLDVRAPKRRPRGPLVGINGRIPKDVRVAEGFTADPHKRGQDVVRIVAARAPARRRGRAAQEFGFSGRSREAAGVCNRGLAGAAFIARNVTGLGDSAALPAFSPFNLFQGGSAAVCAPKSSLARGFFAGLGNTQGSGFRAQTIGLPVHNTVDIGIGDFNGDGIADIVAVSAPDSGARGTGGNLTVLLGLGDGTFGLPHTFPLPGNPVSLAVADVDLDGLADVTVAETGPNEVQVFSDQFLLGHAPTAFDNHPFSLTFTPTGLAAGDVNGDGRPDFVVTGPYAIGAFTVGPDGSTPLGTLNLPFNPVSVAVGRFDSNSVISDIVVAGNGGLTVFGDTPSGLAPLTTAPLFGGLAPSSTFEPRGIFIGQSNFGGGVPAVAKPDTANDIFVAGRDGLLWFKNPQNAGQPPIPQGQFIPGFSDRLTDGLSLADIFATDTNSDNVSDLAIIARNLGTVEIANSPLTTGEPLSSIFVGANPVAMATLNFNNDGRPDLVIVNSPPGSFGNVTVLKNTGRGAFTRGKILPGGSLFGGGTGPGGTGTGSAPLQAFIDQPSAPVRIPSSNTKLGVMGHTTGGTGQDVYTWSGSSGLIAPVNGASTTVTFPNETSLDNGKMDYTLNLDVSDGAQRAHAAQAVTVVCDQTGSVPGDITPNHTGPTKTLFRACGRIPPMPGVNVDHYTYSINGNAVNGNVNFFEMNGATAQATPIGGPPYNMWRAGPAKTLTENPDGAVGLVFETANQIQPGQSVTITAYDAANNVLGQVTLTIA